MKYKIFIVVKYLLSKLLGKISILNIEKKIYRDHFIGGSWQYYQRQGINYIKEKYDLQKSADITIRDGGGDCEDIHRMFVIDYWFKGIPAYLVSIFGVTVKGDKFGHAFCIAKDRDNYIGVDYSDMNICSNVMAVIEHIRFKYHLSAIKGIVYQDINWKIIKEI